MHVQKVVSPLCSQQCLNLNALLISSEQVSQYGEISTVYIGRKPGIVLNTIQVTKEALVQDAFFWKTIYASYRLDN